MTSHTRKMKNDSRNQKILYTTDLSETANFAFSYAASLANHYDAVITILHVLKEAVSGLGYITLCIYAQ